MILAVCGKRQRGKDTLAKILRFLYLEKLKLLAGVSFEKWMSTVADDLPDVGLETVKFADTLKEVSASLLNVRREDFEDQKFKAKSLDEKWTVFQVKYFDGVEHHTKLFASKGTANVFWLKCTKAGLKVENPREVLMTYRDFLIAFGTNAMRDNVHPDIWVFSTLEKIKDKNVIITDLRFKNELMAVKSLPNVVIRVEKSGMPTSDCITETDLDNNYHDFDFVVNNNGTLEDLIFSAKLIINDDRLKPLFK